MSIFDWSDTNTYSSSVSGVEGALLLFKLSDDDDDDDGSTTSTGAGGSETAAASFEEAEAEVVAADAKPNTLMKDDNMLMLGRR